MVDFDVKEVISRIEFLLAKREMSKEEFYTKSGISSASYSQWNTLTHKPTKKKLGAAANCLGVPLEYLLYGSEQKETPTLQAESERIPNYSKLSETNRAIVDSMIAQLLAAQLED
jgi:transcriptional regulator with XRE-family HTH domain